MATQKKHDAGQAEVQEKVEAAEEKGYIGERVDPFPDSAHSLESGPDSPGAADYSDHARKQAADAKGA